MSNALSRCRLLMHSCAIGVLLVVGPISVASIAVEKIDFSRYPTDSVQQLFYVSWP